MLQLLTQQQNPSYLQNQLRIPIDLTLKKYDVLHSDYIERYIIAERLAPPYLEYIKRQQIMVLHAFYPKTLDQVLQPRIIRGVNKAMWLYTLAGYNPPEPVQPDNDDSETPDPDDDPDDNDVR